MARFHSRNQRTRHFFGTKESVQITKELNSHRIGLEHQHGCCDVIVKRSISIRFDLSILNVKYSHMIALTSCNAIVIQYISRYFGTAVFTDLASLQQGQITL